VGLDGALGARLNVRRALAAVILSSVTLGACNSAPPAGLVTQATPTPAPSVVSKDAAAAAYLRAVTSFNQSNHDADKTCQTRGYTAQKKCMRVSYEVLEVFMKAIRAIAFPPGAGGDVSALLHADATLDTYYRDAYGEKTLAAIETWFPKLDKASLTSQAASNVLRLDLGLPPVPIPK
jgi:hypothetical protein